MDETLSLVQNIINARRDDDPEKSYVASLAHAGTNKILEKISEECAEVILAVKDQESGRGNRDAIIHELADLWFHSLVLMSYGEIRYSEVLDELQRRLGRSGLAEKANRAN